MSILGGAIAAGIQGVANIGASALQNTYNKKAATTAYQREVAMWQANNEYNSPAQQVARLKEAGLNPALVYGTGAAVATGNSKGFSSAPQAASGSSSKIDLLAGLSLGQDIAVKDAQKKQIEAESANTQVRTDLARSDLEKSQLSNEITRYNLEYAKKHGLRFGADIPVTQKVLNYVYGIGENIGSGLASLVGPRIGSPAQSMREYQDLIERGPASSWNKLRVQRR